MQPSPTTRARYRLSGPILFGSLVLLVMGTQGCSKNPHAPAKISGALTYKGQPIKGGTMQFHTAEGVAYDAQISPDGTYSATDIPEGELVVTVSTEHLNPKHKGTTGSEADRRAKATQPPPAGAAPPPAPGEYYVKIPAKYSKPNTSPLTVTVESGRQVKDIDLTD